MLNITLVQTFYCPEYSRQHSSKQKYYFGFFVAPTYTYFMCLFSPGWHFKASSKSRLPNSMVVKSCPCKSTQALYLLLRAIFGLQSSLPWREAETSSNLFTSLNFSIKDVFPPTARLYTQLLQNRLRVNFFQQIYYPFPFSPSPHFLQCCLSLLSHHHELHNSPPPYNPITNSIPAPSCLYLGTPIVLHPNCTLSCSPVPSWTYSV